MFHFMNEILEGSRKCFSREAAFHRFVIVVVGLMVRTDPLGVTSFIRELGIRPDLYETMLHFFRATSWELARVRQAWYEMVKAKAPGGDDHKSETQPRGIQAAGEDRWKGQAREEGR